VQFTGLAGSEYRAGSRTRLNKKKKVYEFELAASLGPRAIVRRNSDISWRGQLKNISTTLIAIN